MKYLYIVLLLVCGLSASAQDSTLIWKQKIRNNYIQNENTIEVYYRKSAMSKSLKKMLEEEHYGEFKMAGPSGKYNATDVTSHGGRPFRKMMFLMQNGNYYGLVYKYGGKASGTILAFSEVVDGELKFFEEYHISHDIVTVNDFMEALKIGEILK